MRAVAVGLALISAFFVFYEARLLAVTGFLTHLRSGGQGAYIGAVMFPLIAIGAAWIARIAWNRGSRPQ